MLVALSSAECRSKSGYKTNTSFENVSQFKNMGTTLRNQYLFQGEIKKLNSVNACYCSVWNLRSSRLLSKNVNIRMYKTIIVVLYGC
jgi:hypothetical protein